MDFMKARSFIPKEDIFPAKVSVTDDSEVGDGVCYHMCLDCVKVLIDKSESSHKRSVSIKDLCKMNEPRVVLTHSICCSYKLREPRHQGGDGSVGRLGTRKSVLRWILGDETEKSHLECVISVNAVSCKQRKFLRQIFSGAWEVWAGVHTKTNRVKFCNFPNNEVNMGLITMNIHCISS